MTDGIGAGDVRTMATAGGRDVGMIDVSPAQQVLKAGLVDEIHVHVALILLSRRCAAVR